MYSLFASAACDSDKKTLWKDVHYGFGRPLLLSMLAKCWYLSVLLTNEERRWTFSFAFLFIFDEKILCIEINYTHYNSDCYVITYQTQFIRGLIFDVLVLETIVGGRPYPKLWRRYKMLQNFIDFGIIKLLELIPVNYMLFSYILSPKSMRHNQ